MPDLYREVGAVHASRDGYSVPIPGLAVTSSGLQIARIHVVAWNSFAVSPGNADQQVVARAGIIGKFYIQPPVIPRGGGISHSGTPKIQKTGSCGEMASVDQIMGGVPGTGIPSWVATNIPQVRIDRFAARVGASRRNIELVDHIGTGSSHSGVAHGVKIKAPCGYVWRRRSICIGLKIVVCKPVGAGLA